MNRLAQLGLGVGFALVFAAGAEAQMTASTDQGTAAKPVSHHDKKMIKSCQAMGHDMMMKNSGCMKMMKMHPDMMGADPTSESH